MERSPLGGGLDEAVHFLAVALVAVMWGVLVMLIASAWTAVAYGGRGEQVMFLILWHARFHLWIPVAAWALLAPRSRGLLKWGWMPALFFFGSYAWLAWLHLGAPELDLGTV